MLNVIITIQEVESPDVVPAEVGNNPLSKMEVRMKAEPPTPKEDGTPNVTYMESITFEAIKQGISSAMHVLRDMGPEEFQKLAENEGGAPAIIPGNEIKQA